MKEQKIILTDCDNCMVDWAKGFDKYMLDLGHIYDPTQESSWSIAKRYNISKTESNKLIAAFNRTDHIASLPTNADAIPYITLLGNLGFKFVVITSLGTDQISVDNRHANLYDLFGESIFEEIICLPTGVSKYKELERWEDSGHYWIEDKFSNSIEGMALGLNSILISAPYNEGFGCNRISRVSFETPWKDIYTIIKEEYNF